MSQPHLCLMRQRNKDTFCQEPLKPGQIVCYRHKRSMERFFHPPFSLTREQIQTYKVCRCAKSTCAKSEAALQ